MESEASLLFVFVYHLTQTQYPFGSLLPRCQFCFHPQAFVYSHNNHLPSLLDVPGITFITGEVLVNIMTTTPLKEFLVKWQRQICKQITATQYEWAKEVQVTYQGCIKKITRIYLKYNVDSRGTLNTLAVVKVSDTLLQGCD